MFEQKRQDAVSLMTRSTLTAGLLLITSAATAMELGQLFFSPHERDLMNRKRSAPFSCLKVSGVVVKTGHEQVIWTDKVPETSLDAPTDGVTIQMSVDVPTSVQVRLDRGDTVTLRPGETFDVIGRGVRSGFDTGQQPCAS
jgi:hypothetical protein